MAGQDDTVRSFYSAIAKGDTERAIALSVSPLAIAE
jgi:hypothetical protein